MVMVSNIEQSADGSVLVGTNGGNQQKLAQKFTTGDETNGYTLTQVKNTSLYSQH